jgi:hypothetical protein
LFEHININNILDNNQYGFWPNSSTEKASFKPTDEILKSINNKQLAGGIFCDLQKAFDCVSHDIQVTINHSFVFKTLYCPKYLKGLYIIDCSNI